MADDFNKDTSLEDEIAESLQKLADEETTVAKAFAGVPANTGEKRQSINDINYGKTQVVPVISEEMLKHADNNKKNNYNEDDMLLKGNKLSEDNKVSEDNILLEDDKLLEYNKLSKDKIISKSNQLSKDNLLSSDNLVSEDDEFLGTQKKGKSEEKKNNISEKNIAEKNNIEKNTPEKKHADKKPVIIIASAVAAAVVIAIIIIIAVASSKKKKQTYDYYYNHGMKLYEEGNYADAADMLSKASKDAKGKTNLELKYTLFKCYESAGDESDAVDILKDILSYDENYENAVKSLAGIYYKNEDGDSLTKLIRKYENTSCEDAIEEYMVDAPVPSKESGSYDDNIKLKFTCDTDAVVYYTTDGTEPTKKSTLYDGSAIDIQNGTTKIKAVAIDSIGVCSDVVELEYIIEYDAPDAPDVSPASGKYSEGEKITINNIPDKCKAYYTTDGSTPSASSTEYTGEFDMPVGNTVVSFIIINEHNQSSPVVKRNYNVEVKNKYTFSQAESQLKSTLIEKRVLKSESVAADGSKANFVYETKASVGDKEMYIIRYDVIKNGSTSTAGLYGVDTSSGKVYTVTGTAGSYSATEY